MRRTHRVTVVVACVVVGLVLVCFSGNPTYSSLQVFNQPTLNQMAPDFKLPDQTGKQYSLRDFRGKVVLLDFWASWCGPCRVSMPHVQKLHSRYQSKGLKVIGINIEGPTPRATSFLKNGKFDFMILYDRGNWDSQIAKLYGVRGIPKAFLIDREGILRFSGHPIQLTEALIEKTLNAKKS